MEATLPNSNEQLREIPKSGSAELSGEIGVTPRFFDMPNSRIINGVESASAAWESFLSQISECLRQVEITSADGQKLATGYGMSLWHELGKALRGKNGHLFLVGNGASSSMGNHYATDLSKNAGIRAHSFSDSSLLTAMGNDISFDRVFAEPIRIHANEGDMLVTISSSGNSPNILEAIREARKLGMRIITLSGMKPENKSRQMGDLNIYVPAPTYGLAETSHAALLHFWTDMLVESFAGDAL